MTTKVFSCSCGCTETLRVIYQYDRNHSHTVDLVIGHNLERAPYLHEQSIRLSPQQWGDLQRFVAGGWADEAAENE